MESALRHRAGAAAQADADDSASEAAAWQRDVRVRALERRPHELQFSSRLRRWAWIVALLVHVGLVIGLRIFLHQPKVASATDSNVIEVNLLSSPVAAPPVPPPPSPPPRGGHVRQRPPVVQAAPAVPPAAIEQQIEPEPRLFNQDGSASVPDDLAAQIDRARPKADFIPRQYAPSPLLALRRPLKVRPNHFARYWDGTDGMPLHDRMWKHVTFVKEFTAPWGGRYACAWVLIIVACGDIPVKPWIPPQTWKPATELDER